MRVIRHNPVNRLRGALLRLLVPLSLAFGCGGGVDGKPVPPPTSPVVEPVVPPEPPEMPTNVRVSNRGMDFIEWSWDPMEGVTSYQAHAFPDGTPSDERPPLQTVVEPRLRAEGLEPGTAWGMFVRAIRETAGGRAVSPWAGKFTALTLPPPPGPLAACKDQRQRALNYHDGRYVQVVHEWNHEYPIRFRIEAERIIAGAMGIGRPNFLEEEILEPLHDMARRLEERLGYPIMDLDAPPEDDDYTVTVKWRDHVWSPGWGTPSCPNYVGSPWNAQGAPPATFMNRYFFNPEVTCAAYPP